MKKMILCIFLLIILIISFLLFRFNKYYSVTCDNYAEIALKGGTSAKVNNTIIHHLNEHNIEYSQITVIERGADNSITSISINTLKINAIANELSSNIYNSICEDNHFNIPLGNALGYKYLSGKGPKIELTLIPLNTVNYNIKSEFSEAGINQTVHRIFIEFETTVNCVAPFYDKESKLTFPIVICETLIIGKIPEIVLSS